MLQEFQFHYPCWCIRVKSYVNSFLDPTCVQMRISINKLDLISDRIVAGLVGVFRNGGSYSHKTCDMDDTVQSVDLIAWRRLGVSGRNVTIYTSSDYIVRQTIIHYIIFLFADWDWDKYFAKRMEEKSFFTFWDREKKLLLNLINLLWHVHTSKINHHL